MRRIVIYETGSIGPWPITTPPVTVRLPWQWFDVLDAVTAKLHADPEVLLRGMILDGLLSGAYTNTTQA
jgi:hypothetical protein